MEEIEELTPWENYLLKNYGYIYLNRTNEDFEKEEKEYENKEYERNI